jgi:hypothetical protein
LRRGVAPPTFRAAGLTATTHVCTASLSEQVTAACAALLLHHTAACAPLLLHHTAASAALLLHHAAACAPLLLHHSAALPADALVAARPDRTSTAVIEALTRFQELSAPPGLRSNAGYVFLATWCSGSQTSRSAWPPPLLARIRSHAPGGLRCPPPPTRLSLGGFWSTPIGYAWGQSVRTHAGHQVCRALRFRHGPGATTPNAAFRS